VGTISGAAAGGRGREHGEGSAASFGLLAFPLSWPVIVVVEAAIIVLTSGFPQWWVRHHDASPSLERRRFFIRRPWRHGLTFGVA